MSSKKGAKAPAEHVSLAALPQPAFWPERVRIFEELFAAQQAAFAAKKAPITVTLPDGSKVPAESWVTTPLDIAKRLSNSLPDKVFVARVNEVMWDLSRPLEGDCTLELLDWEDVEAKRVFWHSSAHVMGCAMERVLNCMLSTGPPLDEGGYFYEADTNRALSEADYPVVEAAMAEVVHAKVPFQRLVASKADALRIFAYNPLKATILAAKVPENGSCTLYRCGNLIDPCRGPHLPDTGRVKAYAVTKNSSSYFQGDAQKQALQRLYGISFPKEAQLKEWKTMMEEAAKRDHRYIGKQQELMYFHDVSPGSCFFLPHGCRIYNKLVDFMRKQYWKRGFDEVISPNIFNAKLWMVSGHWAHYKDNMFVTQCEKEDFGLKPMNCPGHCVMFSCRPRSYKELPVRMADFGVLHRNELSGALTGLTRVRRFQQDDAHIFCRPDQVKEEIEGALGFLRDVYDVLGFKFSLKLSTKPDDCLGSPEMWASAEARLEAALNSFCGIPERLPDPQLEGQTFHFDGSSAAVKKLKRAAEKGKKDPSLWQESSHSWELNPKDGAFYGPKIDIVVEDALKRKHQCATVQLDFNLPERFGLKYTLPSVKEGGDAAAAPAQPAPAPAQAAPAAEPAPKQAEQPAKPEPGKKELHFAPDKSLDPNQERPIIIHRAILGSVERCIAVLCEHYGGKWPFWLSPRQVCVVPVSLKFGDYAQHVRDYLHDAGFYVDYDSSEATLEKKIRNAQIAQYNYILVVGGEEVAANSVNIRARDGQRIGGKTLDEARDWFLQLANTYAKDA